MSLPTLSLNRIRTSKSLVVFLGMCLSMLIGVAFQSFLASRLGTSGEADVFYLGATVPTLVATALLGSAANALIRFAIGTPALLTLRGRSSLPARLVTVSLVFSAGMAAAGGALLAGFPPISTVFVRNGVAEFLLLTMPVPPLALLAALGAVRALARRRFVIGTYGGAVNGVGLLAASLAFSAGGLGVHELALAVDCGYLMQLVFVWPTLWSRGETRVGVPGEPDDGVAQRAVRGFLILAAASAVYKSQPLIERGMGAVLGAGTPAALGYAEKITSGLAQLAVFGFALAALPSLSQDLHDGRARQAVSRLQSALAATVASAAAAVAFGVSSADDMVRVLYERGAFDSHSALITHTLVLWALPSVAFGALAGPLVSLGYAAERVRQVALIGLAGFAVSGLATAVLALMIGYRGIVLGTDVGFMFTFLVFATRVRATLGEWSWRAFLAVAGRAMLAAVGAATIVSLAGRYLLPASSASAVVSLLLLSIRFAGVLLAAFGAFTLVSWRRAPPAVVTQA